MFRRFVAPNAVYGASSLFRPSAIVSSSVRPICCPRLSAWSSLTSLARMAPLALADFALRQNRLTAFSVADDTEQISWGKPQSPSVHSRRVLTLRILDGYGPFAVGCPLVRTLAPCNPMFVHDPHVCYTLPSTSPRGIALRCANPSRHQVVEDLFHLQATEHAQSTPPARCAGARTERLEASWRTAAGALRAPS